MPAFIGKGAPGMPVLALGGGNMLGAVVAVGGGGGTGCIIAVGVACRGLFTEDDNAWA